MSQSDALARDLLERGSRAQTLGELVPRVITPDFPVREGHGKGQDTTGFHQGGLIRGCLSDRITGSCETRFTAGRDVAAERMRKLGGPRTFRNVVKIRGNEIAHARPGHVRAPGSSLLHRGPARAAKSSGPRHTLAAINSISLR